MNPTPRANQFWLVLLAMFWAMYGLVAYSRILRKFA
jgi:hypothetical protein